jgi:TP901 family phage tail tape measure protein
MILVKLLANDKASVAVAHLGKTAKSTEVRLLTMGDAIKAVFGAATAYIGIYQLGNALFNVSKQANEFELALRKIKVIGGQSNEEMKEFNTIAKQLADTTEYSATEIAMAGLEISKMGYDVNKTKEMLPDALNLATFASEDLQYSAVNMVRVMNAFTKQSLTATKVSDVFATALNKTSLNAKDLMEGFTYVAPIADTMGYSFEETTALLGFLSDISIMASHGGTTLKNTMLKLLDPTGKVGEALEGVNLDGMSLTKVLGILNDKGVSVQALFKQFDIRALTGALAIGGNTEHIQGLINLLTDAGKTAGTAARGAAEMRQAFTLLWKNLASQVGLAGIALNEAFGSEQKTLIDNLKDSVKDFTTYITNNKEEIQAFGKRFNEVLKTMLSIGSTSIKLVTQNLGFLTTSLGLLSFLKITSQVELFSRGLKNTNKNLDGVTKGLPKNTSAFSLWTTQVTASILVAEGLNSVIQQLIKNWDNWITKSSENFSKNSNSKQMLDDLKRAKDLYEELDESKALFDSHKEMLQGPSSTMGLISISSVERENDIVQRNQKLLDEFIKSREEFYGMRGANSEASWFKTRERVIQNWSNLRNIIKETNKELSTETPDLDKIPRNDGDTDEEKRKNIIDKLKDKGIFGELEAKMRESSAYFVKRGGEEGLIYQLYFGEDGPQGIRRIEDGLDEVVNKIKESGEEAAQDASDVRIAPIVDRMKDLAENGLKGLIQRFQDSKDNIMSVFDSITSASVSMSDIFINVSNKKTENEISNLEKEQQTLEDKYKAEDALGEEHTQFELMRERKRTAERKKLEDELDKKKTELEKREKKRQIIQSSVNAGAAAVSTLVNTPSGPFGKIAAAASVFAIAMGYIAAMSSYRSGTYNAEGNGTSDSNWARISKGEGVISARNMERLGGPDRVKQLIDYSGNKGSTQVNLNINKFYGSKIFARELVPYIKQELMR